MKKQLKGIYIILNKINNKWYVGSSNDISQRWYQHKSLLNRNIHNNPHLQRAWNKYGSDAFEFKVAEELPIGALLTIEQKYLDYAKLHPNQSYNISFDAAASTRGRKHSEETRKKCGSHNIGRIPWNKGIPCSEETKKKISLSKLGKNYDIIPWIKGKHHSKITKQKMSQHSKEKWKNIEFKNNMIKKHKILWKDLDYRKKMLNSRGIH